MPRKIALDFDEVVVQSQRIIRRNLYGLYKVKLPDEVFHFSQWEDPPVTEEQYARAVFQTPAEVWAQRAELVPGAHEGIAQLLAWGIEIEILTSRGGFSGDVEAVQFVLDRYDWNFPIINTSYQPKVRFVGEHALALDDQRGELEAMDKLGLHRLHFQRPHNRVSWMKNGDGIIPVRDWPHVVEVIRDLLPL